MKTRDTDWTLIWPLTKSLTVSYWVIFLFSNYQPFNIFLWRLRPWGYIWGFVFHHISFLLLFSYQAGWQGKIAEICYERAAIFLPSYWLETICLYQSFSNIKNTFLIKKSGCSLVQKFTSPCSLSVYKIKLRSSPKTFWHKKKDMNDDLAFHNSHNFTWLDPTKCLPFLCWFTEILQEVSMKVGIHLKKIQL